MKRLLLLSILAMITAFVSVADAQYDIGYKKIHGADSLIAAPDCFATDFIAGNYEYVNLLIDATTPNANTGTRMKIGQQYSRDGITWYGDAVVKVSISKEKIKKGFKEQKYKWNLQKRKFELKATEKIIPKGGD